MDIPYYENWAAKHLTRRRTRSAQALIDHGAFSARAAVVNAVPHEPWNNFDAGKRFQHVLNDDAKIRIVKLRFGDNINDDFPVPVRSFRQVAV